MPSATFAWRAAAAGSLPPNSEVWAAKRVEQLAETIRDIVNPDATITWDTTKPDGTPRKLLDISRLTALGWKPSIELRDGLESTYDWFLRTSGHRGIDDRNAV